MAVLWDSFSSWAGHVIGLLILVFQARSIIIGSGQTPSVVMDRVKARISLERETSKSFGSNE